MKTITKPIAPFFPSCIIGFRDSRFTRMCRLRRHSRSVLTYSCAGLLRPRLVSTLPFATPRIFDNCIKSTSPGGPSRATPGPSSELCEQFGNQTVKPSGWAVPYIPRALVPKRPEYQTNLIPQSDSCPRPREVTAKVWHGGASRFPRSIKQPNQLTGGAPRGPTTERRRVHWYAASQYGMLWLDASDSGPRFKLGDPALPPAV
jgi:hypothetical protein